MLYICTCYMYSHVFRIAGGLTMAETVFEL